MELDPFTADLGINQGRVPKPERSNGSTDHVMLLGHLQAQRLHSLNGGDFVEIEQEVDLSGMSLLRVRGSLSVPDPLSERFEWEVSLRVDGEKRSYLRARGGQHKSLEDMGAYVRGETGTHRVSLRLELIGLDR